MGNKLKIVAVCSLIILLVAFILINNKSTDETTTQVLEKKEIIIEQSQFIITPKIITSNSNKKLYVYLKVTSYQNPDMLNMNFKDQIMVDINSELISPTDWTIINKEAYKITNELVFNLNTTQNISELMLQIITFIDNEIKWNLDTISIN